MTDAIDALLRDPACLPFRLDPVLRRVLWLRLDAEARHRASFLDERAMPPSPQGGWTPLDALSRLPPPAWPAHAIFHIGHCGSTLLSRVLEADGSVAALREPMPLRTLAEAWTRRGSAEALLPDAGAQGLLASLWAAWSRPLAPARQVLVKATSRCNALAAPVLAAFPGMRVVLLDMPLRPWIATLFKSEASLTDALLPAAERMAFLRSHGIAAEPLHALDLPAQCALGWLAEQIRFQALSEGADATRVLRVDFEDLLADPHGGIERVVAHLQLPAALAAAASASPHWQRYSKAPEHDYRVDDRRHDIDLALQRYGAAVEAGVAAVRAAIAPRADLLTRVEQRLG